MAIRKFSETLSLMSDDALHREVERRRKARDHRSPTALGDDSPTKRQLHQWYANLELGFGASQENVRQAYLSLRDKYHPDQFADSPGRFRASTELMHGLTKAFEGLLRNRRQDEK